MSNMRKVERKAKENAEKLPRNFKENDTNGRQNDSENTAMSSHADQYRSSRLPTKTREVYLTWGVFDAASAAICSSTEYSEHAGGFVDRLALPSARRMIFFHCRNGT